MGRITQVAATRQEAFENGVSHYRSGNDCVNGHSDPIRYAKSGCCLECKCVGVDVPSLAASRESERLTRFAELLRTDVAIDKTTARNDNIPHYLGPKCKNGHLGIRQTANSSCVDCRKANAARVRAADPEKQNAYHREYNRLNPEKSYAKVRRWILKNPERHAANAKAAWRRRRARKLEAEGSHSISEIAELLHKQGQRCAYCGSCQSHSLDHMTPLSRGGSDYIENLQWLCKSCNSRKKDKTDAEYRQIYGIAAVTPWDAKSYLHYSGDK